MKQLTVNEWWNSLTPENQKWCENRYDCWPRKIQKMVAHNIHYFQEHPIPQTESPKFKAGQKVWYKEKVHTFLYFHPKNKGKAYIVNGLPDRSSGKVVDFVDVKDISPEPQIKKGTPVLCWDNGDTKKTIAFYYGKIDGYHTVSDFFNAEQWETRWDNAEVYDPE